MLFLKEKTSHNKNNDIQGSHNKIKITDVQKNHNVLYRCKEHYKRKTMI